MDQRRFDSLARSLAVPRSRRGILGGIAALAAGLLGRRSAAAGQQAACGNVICASDPGRCNDGCVCCVYGNGNSRCRPASTCGGSGGTIACPAGTTFCVSTQSCQECCGDPDCDDGIACTVGVCVNGGCVHTPQDDQCPPGFVCNPEAGCTCPPFQRLSGNACIAACAPGECAENVCVGCIATVDGVSHCYDFGIICGALCTSDDECPDPQLCLQNEEICGDLLGRCGTFECTQ